jgi:hypothetical protein
LFDKHASDDLEWGLQDYTPPCAIGTSSGSEDEQQKAVDPEKGHLGGFTGSLTEFYSFPLSFLGVCSMAVVAVVGALFIIFF